MKIIDRAGQRISNRFHVERTLGHGGMGTVYLAHDDRKHRNIALKVLHDKHRNRDWIVARFAREVDILRKLEHPNVVDLIDAGHDDRMLYYTMEYIKGYNLREWMYRHNPMDFGSTVHVLCLAAKGLHYVHKRYIHRDIAPENVMVCKDGTVKVIDFGLARKNECTEGLTILGTSLGRTEYNAPEQARDAATADTRADIYPLGIMLYEMMTGRLPSREATPEALAQELPDGCLRFLQRTLAPNPGDRYATAGEAGEELLRIHQCQEKKLSGIKPALSPPPAVPREVPNTCWARFVRWLSNLFSRQTF